MTPCGASPRTPPCPAAAAAVSSKGAKKKRNRSAGGPGTPYPSPAEGVRNLEPTEAKEVRGPPALAPRRGRQVF